MSETSPGPAAQLLYSPGKRFPALDGVRGLAFLAVLVGHSWELVEPPGTVTRLDLAFWLLARLGVYLFFLLSGFLITGILQDAKSGDGYFRNFYARRFLRIFPLYYFYLLLMLVLLPVLLAVPWRDVLVWNWPLASYWLYANNLTQFYAALHGISAGPWQSPVVQHFWSLAIEEQFYLLWPLVVFLLPRRALQRLCLAIALLTPIGRYLLELLHPGATHSVYMFTPLTLDCLALGGWIALTVRGTAEELRTAVPWIRPVAALSLLGMLTVMALNIKEGVRDPASLFLSFFGILGAALLFEILLLRARQLQRLCSWGALTNIGIFSYGLYVYHNAILRYVVEPLTHTTRQRFGHGGIYFWFLADLLLCLALTYAVARASWWLFESRMLRLKRFFEYHDRNLRSPELRSPDLLDQQLLDREQGLPAPGPASSRP